jgi:hypothetical protein
MLGWHEQRNARAIPTDATRAQAATNRRSRGRQHLIPRVLNPGPLPLGPGIETRHTTRSPKATDVTRF